MELRVLRNQLRALSSDLRRIVDKDPEQVVQHWALPMIDELLTQAKAYLAGNPVIDRIDQLFSPEMVESQTEELRALEAFLIVNQVFEALPVPGDDYPDVPPYLRP